MKKLLRGIAGLIFIVVVIVGVPWLLVRLVGWPGPDRVPGWDETRRVVVQRDFGTAFVLGLLAVIGWFLWAQVVWATVWELAVNVGRSRNRRAPRPAPLVAAPIGRIVAIAIMSVLAVISKPAPGVALNSSALVVPHAAVATTQVDSASVATTATGASDQQLAAARQASTPAASETQRWTVKEGDTLWDIAEDVLGDGARVDEIVRLNPQISSPDRLNVGMELVLPGQAGSSSVVEVVRGDNLWNLTTEAWGDTDMGRIQEVADRNNISNPHLIFPGQQIDIAEPGLPLPQPSPAPHGQRDGSESNEADGQHHQGDRQTFEVSLSDSLNGSGPMDGVDAGAATQVALSGENGGAGDLGDGIASEDESGLSPLEVSGLLSTGLLGLLALRRRSWWQAMLPWRQTSRDARRLEGLLQAAARTRAINEAWSEQRLMTVWEGINGLVETSGHRLAVLINRGSRGVSAFFLDEVDMPAPWRGGGRVWNLDGDSVSQLANSQRAITLSGVVVQLGTETDGSQVFADLHVLRTLEIGGPENAAEAVCLAIEFGAAATSYVDAPLIISVGNEVSPNLPNVERVNAGNFAAAVDRVHMLGGGNWSGGSGTKRAVVTVGPAVPNVRPLEPTAGALVSASAVNGPSHFLAPDGDHWILRPLGILLRPIGVDRVEADLLAELFDPYAEGTPADTSTDQAEVEQGGGAVGGASAELYEPESATGVHTGSGPGWLAPPADSADPTIPPLGSPVAAPDSSLPGAVGGGSPMHKPGRPGSDEPAPALGAADSKSAPRLRLCVFGSAEVVGPDGQHVGFADPQQLELLMWLATHRSQPSRTAARGAIWNFDIGDDEFRRVLQGLRATLTATLGNDPEWVGDGETELVPLHIGIHNDAEALERALAWSASLGPSGRVETLSPVVPMLRGLPFYGMGYRWAQIEGIEHHMIGLGTRIFVELARAHRDAGNLVGAQDTAEDGLAVFVGHEGLFEEALSSALARNDAAEVRRLMSEYGPSLPDAARERWERDPALSGFLSTTSNR